MNLQTVKNDVRDYYANVNYRNTLLESHKKIGAKLTQCLTPDKIKSSNMGPTGVEKIVLDKMNLEERIKKINEHILYIDEAKKTLNVLEKEVITYIQNGYSIVRISDILFLNRYKVMKIRDSAIEKIYLNTLSTTLKRTQFD